MEKFEKDCGKTRKMKKGMKKIVQTSACVTLDSNSQIINNDGTRKVCASYVENAEKKKPTDPAISDERTTRRTSVAQELFFYLGPGAGIPLKRGASSIRQ